MRAASTLSMSATTHGFPMPHRASAAFSGAGVPAACCAVDGRSTFAQARARRQCGHDAGRDARSPVPVSYALVLFSVAFFAQQSWSGLIMTIPADVFPLSAVGTVSGLVGFGGSIGGAIFGLIAGALLGHGFTYGDALCRLWYLSPDRLSCPRLSWRRDSTASN